MYLHSLFLDPQHWFSATFDVYELHSPDVTPRKNRMLYHANWKQFDSRPHVFISLYQSY